MSSILTRDTKFCTDMNELKELEFDISEAEYEASKLLADGNMNDYLEMQDHITSLKLRRDRIIKQSSINLSKYKDVGL